VNFLINQLVDGVLCVGLSCSLHGRALSGLHYTVPDFPVFEVHGGQALEDCQLGLRLQGHPVVLSVWHFQ
jgi:hypothetical protein